MKSRIQEKEICNEEKTYPYIGIDRKGLIVLFCNKQEGVILKKPEEQLYNRYKVGDYREDWVQGAFQVFDKEVVLSN